MESLWMNLKFALRQLRRSPGFALTAALTLALGIGANTAIFSFLDQALLRPLPVKSPAQLVVLEGTGEAWEGHSSSHGGDKAAYFSYPMYRDLRDQDKAFSGMLADAPADMQVGFGNNLEITTGEIVSGNYFSLLGVEPFMGRLFTQADDTAAGANAVAVVGYDFWREKRGADPGVVGRTITVNGQMFAVLGIAPPAFHSAVWGETPSLFVPMSMLNTVLPGQGKRLVDHKDRWLNILARLRAGTSVAQAQADSAPLWHALRAAELAQLGHRSPHFIKEFLTDSRLLLLPGARGFSYQRGDLKTPLLVVMGMALLVLLMASVNVASLLLVRSSGRVREFSLRAAMGAQPGRIVQQLLLEGLLIGLLGGVAGLLLAPLAAHALVSALAGPDGGGAFTAQLDWRVLGFNFAVALLVSLAFSLAPAMQMRRPDLTTTLRGVSTTGAGGLMRVRRVIVALQIGLSVLLLVGSGLFVRTMQNLRAVDLGFRSEHLVTFGLTPRLAGYTPEHTAQVQQRALEAMQALPGVTEAGATNSPELGGNSHGGNISIAGYVPARDEEVDVTKTDISPNYFKVLGVPVIAGRALTVADDAQHPLVAVINETMARRYFGSAAKAIGHHISEGSSDTPQFDTEVVGVVRDFKSEGVRSAVDPTVFRNLQQPAGKPLVRELHLYLRTTLPAAETFQAARHAMQQVDAGLALDGLRTLDQQIDENLRQDRLVELLAVAFGVLATLLAGVGLYGVLAYSTAQRTREIGIRMALGSSRAAVSRLILGDVLKLAALGLAVGLPVAALLTHALHSLLFGVSASDPAVLLSVVLLIAAIALVAALLPVRRAVSVDPNQALRAE